MRLVTSPLELALVVANNIFEDYFIINFDSKAEKKRFEKMIMKNLPEIKKIPGKKSLDERAKDKN